MKLAQCLRGKHKGRKPRENKSGKVMSKNIYKKFQKIIQSLPHISKALSASGAVYKCITISCHLCRDKPKSPTTYSVENCFL